MQYEVRLYTPGPTPIHPRALKALAWPMRSHMDPDMVSFNDGLARDLEVLYGSPDDGFACVSVNFFLFFQKTFFLEK